MTETRFSASVTTMFREVGLLERFAAAKRAGLDGVEIQDLGEGDVDAMAEAARAADIPVLLVNADMGDFRQGGPGLSGAPGREAVFLAGFERTLDAAARLGVRFIHLGPSRIPAGERRETCLAAYRRNLAEAVLRLQARRLDITLLIEAINAVDYPAILIRDLDEAAQALSGLPAERTGLLFDTYHLAMGDRDLVRQFQAHQRLIRHVQFSNIPGRDEPEVGEIDFARLFVQLTELGYRGWFGAEYTPRRATSETLNWLQAYRRDQ
jgi:hydroxypyruvate isomerase